MHELIEKLLMIIITTLTIVFFIWFSKRYLCDLFFKQCWNDLKSKPDKAKETFKSENVNCISHTLHKFNNLFLADHVEIRKLQRIEMADLSKGK